MTNIKGGATNSSSLDGVEISGDYTALQKQQQTLQMG